jgi:threonine/homoserine/homoserine lactone efflux protein
MKFLVVELCAYLMGFLAAIPLGATQLEIARRVLAGYPRAALMVVAGSVLSDTMYGFFAFFGIAPFLEARTVLAYFWLANAVILLFLGLVALRHVPSPGKRESGGGVSLERMHLGFAVGFSLAVTNPLMIFWWLLGGRVVVELGLIDRLGGLRNVLFLFAGAAGIGSYLTLLTLGIYRAKHFFSSRTMRRLTIVLGVGLLLLAVISAIRSASSFST